MTGAAAHCGVSKALIYHYYDSKDALLFDILHTHLSDLVETVSVVTKGDDQLRQLIRAILLAYRNAWDTGGLTEKVAAAVIESDRDTRAKMYADIQAEFRDIAPFAVLFQKIEQTGRNEAVQNLNLGGAITAVSYWPVTK